MTASASFAFAALLLSVTQKVRCSWCIVGCVMESVILGIFQCPPVRINLLAYLLTALGSYDLTVLLTQPGHCCGFLRRIA